MDVVATEAGMAQPKKPLIGHLYGIAILFLTLRGGPRIDYLLTLPCNQIQSPRKETDL